MSQVIRHSKGKIRPPKEPRPTTVRIEHGMSQTVGWFVHRYRVRRIKRAARPNVDPPKKWYRRLYVRILEYLAILGAVGLLAWLGWAAYVVYRGEPTRFETYCAKAGTCGVLIGFTTPFLTLGAAVSVFLIWRLRRVTKPILGKARDAARELVPTAGTIVDRVVGRDELCLVIMEVLRDRDNRRPYLLVGGVGTGKTAVLVRLTEMLAAQQAVPVPIRLRDAEQLNFNDLARQRFAEEVGASVLPPGFAERVWRQLRVDDRVVVLADGLEEAFVGAENEKDRDNFIRMAIQHAREEKLPLVIASRPHHPLEATQAAMMELEPLSEEAALDYIERETPAQDEHRLDWIVETADVADAPLYLQITRQLYDQGRLEHLISGTDARRLNTRGGDRSALRWRLLDTWRKALIDGHLHPQLAVGSSSRARAIEYISALACIGLLKDRLEVSFDELTGAGGAAAAQQAPTDGRARASQRHRPVYPGIWRALKVSGLPEHAEPHHYTSLLSLFATLGEQLGLVEVRGNLIRFPHSIVQAYLGSGFLSKITSDDLAKALDDPGRELLIALVLDSRRPVGTQPPGLMEAGQAARPDHGQGVPAERGQPLHKEAGVRNEVLDSRQLTGTRPPGQVEEGQAAGTERGEDLHAQRVRLLLKAAEKHYDAKAFDIYAAALEIDSVQAAPQHLGIARSLAKRWQQITIGDQRTIEEAKLGVVHRFGEALREITRRHQEKTGPAYQEFFDIGCGETSYPVRLAIAQEIGIGGDEAFRLLCHGQPDPWGTYRARDAKLRSDESRRAAADEKKYQRLRISGHEETDADRAVRVEEEHKIHEETARDNREARTKLWHEFVMRAWLAPMLLGSVGDEYRDEAVDHLENWLRHIGRQVTGDDKPLPVRLEVALAQGFKSTANRRRRHPNTWEEARSHLTDGAEQMLEHCRYWYCQLILIHALSLWALPDEPGQPRPDRPGRPRDGRNGQAAARGRGLGPVETVGRWLTMAGAKRAKDEQEQRARLLRRREREHPFVAEAGDLAALALESGHPERFIWIDESGVMNKVGSRPARPTDYRKHSLWIPPSAGWSALDRRAQQLLADVLIMLNLTEGGNGLQPEEREQRLQRANRDDLPPCLTKDRRPLRPRRTIGMPGMAKPDRKCLHGCAFELCPYPPSGALPRAELSEAFCRRQQAMLGHRFRRLFLRKTARWQGITVRELNSFWGEMASRTRPHGPAESQ